ncbi:hypothetical protein ACV07N_04445 [Roseivirga echinicomitans]
MKIIGEKLSQQEMLMVKGGIVLCCHCGFGGAPPGSWFPSYGVDVSQAITNAGMSCDPEGATCNGESGPGGDCIIRT